MIKFCNWKKLSSFSRFVLILAFWVTWLKQLRDFRNCKQNISRKSITKNAVDPKRGTRKALLSAKSLSVLLNVIVFVYHISSISFLRGGNKKSNNAEEEKKKSFTEVELSFCCCRKPKRTFLRERVAEPRLGFLSFPYRRFSCLQYIFDA